MNKIVVLTGAGISQESGLDTFRDANGIWAKYNMEEVCTLEGFKKNPEKNYMNFIISYVRICLNIYPMPLILPWRNLNRLS